MGLSDPLDRCTLLSVKTDNMQLGMDRPLTHLLRRTTGAVLGRQNTSSEQPPPNMAAANFVVITNREGCALNGTAVAAVLIDQ